jgi:hypothetical protein
MKITQSFPRSMRITLVLLTAVAINSITGCAQSGPKYAAVKNDITPLSKEKGRIVVYRPIDSFDGYRPAILLDDNQVGISRSNTIFYVDADPGEHQVRWPNVQQWLRGTTVNITLSKNEIVYIKHSIVNWNLTVESVNSKQAMAEIDELEFITETVK